MFQLNKYIARLMMISFFLPMQLQVVACVGSAIYFISTSFYDGAKVSKGRVGAAVLLGFLYLLYLGAVLFTPDAYKAVALKYCEYKVSFLLLPLLFSLIEPAKLRVIYDEIIYFVFGTLMVGLIANIAFFATHGLGSAGQTGLSHVVYRVFFEQFTGQHPTYMSMYIAFSIGILLLCGERMTRRIKYVLFYVLIILLLALLAKSPILALFVIFVHYAWLNRDRIFRYKWLAISGLALVVASYFFIPFVGQRVNEMFTGGNHVGNSSIYARKIILTVDLNLLKNHWLWGVGPGRILYLLHMRHFFYSTYLGYYVGAYDPHNEYLFQWLALGIAGVILLVSVFVVHVWKAMKSRNYLYLYLMIIISITCVTESVLCTQHGLMFYAVFSSLFFFQAFNRKVNE